MKLSLIIPCYNNEKSIDILYDDVKNNYNKMYDYELIFVNDGSSDDTLLKLKELGKLDKKRNKIISFSRSFGQDAAMLAGMKEAKGDYVGIIDINKPQGFKIILDMLDILENDTYYDSVAAYQKELKENKFVSFLKKNFYEIINDNAPFKIKQNVSKFRLFRRNVVEAVLLLEENNRFSEGIFSWVGFNTYYLPYNFYEGDNTKIKFKFNEILDYSIKGILSCSINPLKTPIILGMIFSVLFLISFIIFIITRNVALGICTLILFISAIQFFIIGIICGYISQMHIQSKNRPIYIIKEKINIK